VTNDDYLAMREAESAVEQAAAKIVEAVDSFVGGPFPPWIEPQAIAYRAAVARLAELEKDGEA
jgi:predicted ATPase